MFLQLFSVSLAEGLNLPGSDMDVMFVMKYIKVINKWKNLPIPKESAEYYVMETYVDHPGFAKLRLVSTPFYLSARSY